MGNAIYTLRDLRRLRVDAAIHAAKASDFLAMASRGMSAKRAMDTGGTGNCPLTDFTEKYAAEKNAALSATKQADVLWAKIEPLLADVDFDAGSLIALYYNQALSWEDMRARLKRSEHSCQRMHWDMVRRLDGML